MFCQAEDLVTHNLVRIKETQEPVGRGKAIEVGAAIGRFAVPVVGGLGPTNPFSALIQEAMAACLNLLAFVNLYLPLIMTF